MPFFFCGDKRRDELPGKLRGSGVLVDEVIVYHTIYTPVAVTKNYDAILFFSPSAVQSFFSMNTVNPGTQLFAIGTTTAEAIERFSKNNVIIAATAGKENLARQVMEFYRRGG